MQETRTIHNTENNNFDMANYLRTDSCGDRSVMKSIYIENEKKLTENGKNNRMETSFSENVQLNFVESISDQVFFNDTRKILIYLF